MWWDEDEARWEREVKDMKLWFPTSDWGEFKSRNSSTRYWEIIVEPIPQIEEHRQIISDLERDAPVDVLPTGKLTHSQRCHANHLVPQQLTRINLYDEAFLVRLIYQSPPAHPKAMCIDPLISRASISDHPHLYDPSGHICPLYPPDGTWQWKRNTGAEYMFHVSLWLFKTAVWLASRKANGAGYWLGSDVGHTLVQQLRTHPSLACMCGSGVTYRRCHRQMHRFLLERAG